MTTELCHLSCVMCYFNGPKARRGTTTLDPDLVLKVLSSRPKNEKILFVATGEFFSDPNALLYIRMASELGLWPRVITHGQLLTPEFIDRILAAGLKELLISVDSIDKNQYAKIRRGGTLDVILNACAYFKQKKMADTDLRLGITVICFPKSNHSREEVVDFWRERVDYIQFVSEYYDVFQLRRLFFLPDRRVNCSLKLIPLPSGYVAPCCAIAIYSHDHDVSWLPHLANVSPKQAYDELCNMYEDQASPLAHICTKCNWWTQFYTNEKGNTPIFEMIEFNHAADQSSQ
jgi:MoaA/NifB/PqqE/SkfB family radical SAM enzyme